MCIFWRISQPYSQQQFLCVVSYHRFIGQFVCVQFYANFPTGTVPIVLSPVTLKTLFLFFLLLLVSMRMMITRIID
jgi:hypothetical protein